MNRKAKIKVALGVLLVVARVGSGDEPAPQLGKKPTEPSAAAVIDGSLKLLETSMHGAVEHLQDRDVAAFVLDYEQFVLGYTDLAHRIGSVAKSKGAATSRLEMARHVVRGLATDHSERAAIQGRLDKLTNGVALARKRLLEQLTDLQRRYRQSDDASERRKILEAMDLTTDRIDQLETLIASKQQAAEAGFTVEQLAAPIEALWNELKIERDLLTSHATAISELVEVANRHMDDALTYSATNEQVPRHVLQELINVRHGIQALTKQLDRHRAKRSAFIADMVDATPLNGTAASQRLDDPESRESILSRVESVLRREANPNPIIEKEARATSTTATNAADGTK